MVKIDDEDVAGHDSHDKAISIDPGEEILLSVQMLNRQNVGDVNLRVEVAGRSRSIHEGSGAARTWSDRANARQDANLGVGLYKVTLNTSGGCNATAWVNVEGNPFLTVAGGMASAVLLAGIGLQLFGLIRGVRGKGGFKWALLGGIPTGLGACVLAQQFGATPITPEWVAGWTTPPVAVGGILQAGTRMLGRGRDGAAAPPAPSTGGTAPAPPMPPAPTPTQPGGPVTSGTAPATSGPPTSIPPPAGVPAPGAGGRTYESLPPEEPTPGGTIGPGAGPDETRDPPRTSFALLDCPDVVVAAQEFELSVGLTPSPHPGVSGGPLVRPPTSVGDYVLTIQVVADGFSLAEGESWRHSLPVTFESPYPAVTVRLTADGQDAAVKPRTVQAVFSVNGHTMGLAVRAVAVVRNADVAAPVPPPAGEGIELGVPLTEPAADLTVRIQRAPSQSGGKLMWTFDTPHAGIRIPDEPAVTDIGDEPESFVRQLITGISVQEGRPGLHAYLQGVGLTIADEMPQAFWTLLDAVAAVAAAASRPPTVFLLSEEPYVPWELAITPERLSSDPAASRFLGAQACVGRWVLSQRRPKLPPPAVVQVHSMAVISGVYDEPGWSRLLDAEAEAAELVLLYQGLPVEAAPLQVLRCLEGDPEADLLHFSLHGVYDPGSITNGLVLVDGSALDPLQVKGGMLSSSPFVFLNACQVGAGSRLLGDYAGMAEAFLYAGAAGVIAPLWSISDTLARGVARRFYEAAFTGTPPAEVLRQERAAFGADSASATGLAYLYYGHPSLRLNRAEP